MSWSQVYDPLDNRVLSTAVSALPVLTLFRPRDAEETRAGIGAEWLRRRGHAGAVRLRYAGAPGRHGRRPRRHLRRDADRLDRRRIDLSLQRRLRDGAVRRDEGLDCRAVDGQAPAAGADRVLLRRVSRGRRRRRRTGGDCRLVPHRPRLRAVSSSDALPCRQHGAGRVGRRWQSDSDACGCHRAVRIGVQRDGRTHSAAGLTDPAALVGAQHGRVARDVAGLAGAPPERRLLRRHAVLLVQLSGVWPRRHCVGCLLAAGWWHS
jgi:hypothetical protein